MKTRRAIEDIRKLRELQRLGMDVARDLHARAKGERDPRKLIELADSLLLVGEEIREAVLLEAKLRRELKAAALPDPALPDPALPDSAPPASGRQPRPGPRRRQFPTDPRLAADPPTSTRH